MFMLLMFTIKELQIWYKCLLNGELLTYKMLMKCDTDLKNCVIKYALQSGICLGHKL